LNLKVYIAGPMRGLPNWNQEAFDEAEQRWKDQGWTVYSPAALVRAMPYYGGEEHNKSSLIHVAQMDLGCLYHCDAIALLPGWQKSIGTTMELATAQFIGLVVYDAIDMKLIDPDRKPWSELQCDCGRHLSIGKCPICDNDE
jgi:hypothetical protein